MEKSGKAERMWKTQRRAKASPFGSNGDDRRQRRKQGGAVGAAASRMQATAKQTLGAATRAVALRSNDGEGKLLSREPPHSDKLSLCQSDTIAAPALLRQRPCPLRRFAPALPRGEPFHLHDTAPLRWNKWRSSYKLNDTSLNISCSPTWRSSPDWRSTYFASWAQVRHLGEVRFTSLVC